MADAGEMGVVLAFIAGQTLAFIGLLKWLRKEDRRDRVEQLTILHERIAAQDRRIAELESELLGRPKIKPPLTGPA